MAERIVSPGVFTTETDLSFLPAGIGEIGAVVIGPTKKGPAFHPTIIESIQEFDTVFGGIDSGITSATKEVFLESAYFDPVRIRKTAKRHGLNTDASYRFERGIDIELCEYALKRAALLIMEFAGGEITSEISDDYPNKAKPHQLTIQFEYINKLIGHEIPIEHVKSILTSLDIKINSLSETTLLMLQKNTK